MIALATMLLTLGGVPPTEVMLVSGVWEFEKAHPCKTASPKPDDGQVLEEACLDRLRLVFTHPRIWLAARLQVLDLETGAALNSVRTFGSYSVDGGWIYFNSGESLEAISLLTPKDPPKVLGAQDCGGEGSPEVFAVANRLPLCLLAPEQNEKAPTTLQISGGGKGVCVVAQAAWKKSPAGYTLATELLSATCKKVLGVAQRTGK